MDSTGCCEIKVRTDTAKCLSMKIARFRQRRDLVRKSEVFIKHEDEIVSSVSITKWRVVCCLSHWGEIQFEKRLFLETFSESSVQFGISGAMHVLQLKCFFSLLNLLQRKLNFAALCDTPQIVWCCRIVSLGKLWALIIFAVGSKPSGFRTLFHCD